MKTQLVLRYVGLGFLFCAAVSCGGTFASDNEKNKGKIIKRQADPELQIASKMVSQLDFGLQNPYRAITLAMWISKSLQSGKFEADPDLKGCESTPIVTRGNDESGETGDEDKSEDHANKAAGDKNPTETKKKASKATEVFVERRFKCNLANGKSFNGTMNFSIVNSSMVKASGSLDHMFKDNSGKFTSFTEKFLYQFKIEKDQAAFYSQLMAFVFDDQKKRPLVADISISDANPSLVDLKDSQWHFSVMQTGFVVMKDENWKMSDLATAQAEDNLKLVALEKGRMNWNVKCEMVEGQLKYEYLPNAGQASNSRKGQFDVSSEKGLSHKPEDATKPTFPTKPISTKCSS